MNGVISTLAWEENECPLFYKAAFKLSYVTGVKDFV